MKTKLLLNFLALFALVSIGLGQEANNYFLYIGGGEAGDCSFPLTYNAACWQGTPIPDGTTVNVYKNGALCWSFPMNSDDGGCSGGGFFVQWDPCLANNGEQLYVQVQYESCTYTSATFTVASAPEPQFYYLLQSDWSCDCGGDPCSVVDASETGSAGPYDIASGETRSFVDTCTVRITAVGGDADGVSVEVFDAVPQYHPVAYNYMSRVVAIYWNASVDPNTTLHVRMYYTNAELNESGFASSGCVIGARFDEFAANWSPVSATSGLKYIEFDTDRSGYYTFDCHAAAPRVVSMGDPKVASGDGELVLRWQTKDEFENYRFHVMRADRPEGPFAEIATVDSKLPNIMTVGSYDYEYRDSGLQNGRTYFFRLSSEDLHGNSAQPGITVSGAPSPTGEEVQISEYSLHPAYPNPFNPETRITYDVLEAGHVNLRVFDILGREVARLVDSDQPKGRYSTIFNAHDLPSGLYFYRINIGGKYTSTQKMLLLK
jgi:hypothetical protein